MRGRRQLTELLVGILGGGVALLLLLAIPQIALIQSTFSLPELSFQEKMSALVDALWTSFTVIPVTHQITLVCIVILTGINVGLAVKLFKNRRIALSGHAAGFAGIMAGILGAGCSACGSVLLVSLLGLAGASPLLAALPFHGFEFSIASVILSLCALVLLVREVRLPQGCAITRQ